MTRACEGRRRIIDWSADSSDPIVWRPCADLEEKHDPRGICRSAVASVVWLDKLDVTDPQRLCQFEQRDHRRIAATPFQAAQVLLTEARTRFDLLCVRPLARRKRAKFRPTSLRMSMRNGSRVYTLEVYEL
jgi:hypothetical protein